MIPILYESQMVSIQSLWVFVVIGLLFSSTLAIKRLKRRRLDFTVLIEHIAACMFSALLFSRTVYFFTNPDAYFPAFDLRTLINFVSIWDQGFSLWGAVLGFTLALSFFVRKAKETLSRWFDALSVPFLVGLMIGEIGALLGGYDYGTPTDLPWGVTYEVFNVKYTVPIHPVQIYLILAVGLLLWSKKKLKSRCKFFKRDGNSTLYLAWGFSLISSALEFIRGDDTLLILGQVRLSQAFYGLIFIITSVLLYKRIVNPKPDESLSTSES